MTAPAPASDAAPEELLQGVARGDARAFRRLVDQFLRPITHYAQRLLGSRSEAEEVAQETFLRVWQRAADFEPGGSARGWIYRVARNLCLDRLRRRRPSTTEAEVDGPASQQPAQLLERKEELESFRVALDQLPPRQKEALVLVHFQGLSGAEAAELLGLGEEALESLLARGRRALRAALRSPDPSLAPLTETHP